MNINKNVDSLSYPEYANAKKCNARIDLSLSENSLISDRVQKILPERTEVNKYKLTQDPVLIKKLAERLGAQKENILITAGCDGALHHIAETFINEGARILIPCPSFGRYEFHTKVMGGKPIFVNFSEYPFEFEISKIITATQKKKAKLLFLANPNNPTGCYIEKEEINRLASKLKETMIVIDETLIDYLASINSCSDLVNSYNNLIVTRSFSKFYGLAGMRIGYMISNKDIIDSISKTVSPFETSYLSIKTAIEVLDDYKYIKRSKRLVLDGLEFLKNNCKLRLSRSKSSVILIYDENQRNLHSYLLRKGILTVNGNSFRGLEKANCVRICVKEIEQLRELVDMLNRK
jgi:histidinol-phosphate aminotransferase